MFLLAERKTTGKYLAFWEKISIFVEVMNTTKWIFFSFVDFIIVINDWQWLVCEDRLLLD